MTVEMAAEFQKTPKGEAMDMIIALLYSDDREARAEIATWLTDSGFPYKQADVLRESGWYATPDGKIVAENLKTFLTRQSVNRWGSYGSENSPLGIQTAVGTCIILAILNLIFRQDMVLTLILVGIIFLLETLAVLSNRRV